MDTREWALVAFTILAQMAVGSFLVLGAVHFMAKRKAGEAEADRLSDRALLAIGPVLILGMLASLFHLGNPASAYRAIANVGSSWLSREILFGVLFAGAGFIFAIMQWRKLGTPGVRTSVALLASVFGIALVYSMSHVYMLPNQPSWNSAATPLSFFTTTLLLGALAMGAAFSANYTYLKSRGEPGLSVQSNLLRDTLRWIAVASIVLLGVELVVIPLYVADLSTGGATALESVSKLTDDYGIVFALRLILGVVGAGLFALYLYRSALMNRQSVMFAAVYAAFALVLVAEVLGRFLFYASQVRVGL